MNGQYVERYVTCPYNPLHLELEHRMARHLRKCSRSHPDMLAICPYNTIHHVPHEELEQHMATCVDREKLYQFMATNTASADRIEVNLNSDPEPIDGVKEESWNDIETECYDPQRHCQAALVLRQLNNAPKVERRLFQEAERLRFHKLEQQQQIQRMQLASEESSDKPESWEK